MQPGKSYAAGEVHGQSGGIGFTESWAANFGVTEVQSGSLSFTRSDGYTYGAIGGKLQLTGNADRKKLKT